MEAGDPIFAATSAGPSIAKPATQKMADPAADPAKDELAQFVQAISTRNLDEVRFPA